MSGLIKTITRKIWIFVYILFAVINLLKIFDFVPVWVLCLATFLACPFLVLVYISHTKHVFSIALLVFLFSFTGEMASNFENFGFASFAVIILGYMMMHICYIWTNFLFIEKIYIRSLIISLNIVMVYSAILFPALNLDTSNYLASSIVIIYIFAIFINLITSIQITTQYKIPSYAAGIIFFLISDTLIALTHFPLQDSIPKIIPYTYVSKLFISATYFTAMGFYTYGLCKVTVKRRTFSDLIKKLWLG
jgi:hypothetical protein